MDGLRCGFIGLGAMGTPMAGHLNARGLLAVVGNRSHDKAIARAAEWGVRAAGEPTDFAGCDCVVLCLPADPDVLQWVEALAGVLAPGAVVVDHSTVAADTARQAAEYLDRAGIGFLDAPVSGGVEGARNGRLSIMVGGRGDLIERIRPALDAYAVRIAHLGAVGQGQACKAVNQVMVAGINEAVCEALALGRALGLDPDVLLPTLSAGAAGNWFLEKRGATLMRGEFNPGFKCAHLLKDLDIVAGMARAVGIDSSVITQASVDYRRLVERGLGEADTSALVLLKGPVGTTDSNC